MCNSEKLEIVQEINNIEMAQKPSKMNIMYPLK